MLNTEDKKKLGKTIAFGAVTMIAYETISMFLSHLLGTLDAESARFSCLMLFFLLFVVYVGRLIYYQALSFVDHILILALMFILTLVFLFN